MSHFEVLTILADDSSTLAERRRAASALLDLLRTWVPGAVRRFSHRFASYAEDVINHIAMNASVGTARFHGPDERAAIAWCKCIMRNYVVDLARRSPPADGDLASLAVEEHEGLTSLEHLLDLVTVHIATLHRAADVPSINGQIRIYLEHRVRGDDLQHQVNKYERLSPPDDEPGSGAWIHARDRIYAKRRRGREHLCDARDALSRTGVISSAEDELLVMLFGCKPVAQGPPTACEVTS